MLLLLKLVGRYIYLFSVMTFNVPGNLCSPIYPLGNNCLFEVKDLNKTLLM